MGSAETDRVDWAACGSTLVEQAVHQVLENRGCVTPRVEAQVQSALDMLRRSGCGDRKLGHAEKVSTALFALAGSRVRGQINLHESQLLRLTRPA